jgi:hypothetical protein
LPRLDGRLGDEGLLLPNAVDLAGPSILSALFDIFA